MADQNIFIVEDHPIMRDLLRAYVNNHRDYSVSGVARSGEEAIAALELERPDLVIVDVSLPDMSGIDLVAELIGKFSDLRCIMLSGHHDASYVSRSLDAGARGYIIKGQPAELFEAIETVMTGEIYVSEGPGLTDSPLDAGRTF